MGLFDFFKRPEVVSNPKPSRNDEPYYNPPGDETEVTIITDGYIFHDFADKVHYRRHWTRDIDQEAPWASYPE